MSVPTCHCQSAVAASAIVRNQDRTVQQSLDAVVLESLAWNDSFDRFETVSSVSGEMTRHAGPPLRKTLCRWVI